MDFTTWGPHRGTPWTRGPWKAELRGDEIADLRYDGVLVLRSIRAVSRDRDWGTVPVSVLSLTHGDGGSDAGDETAGTTTFRLRYDGQGIAADADLHLHTDGDRLTITFTLTATRSFDTNRTGLVVLHPPQVAGSPFRVVHTDGSSERTQFPDRISPHQPALNIAALEWSVDGLDLKAQFIGDTFEMEDQRNWTDASFKTYSRPLALPFPYRVEAGETTIQQIELTAVPAAATSPQAPAAQGTLIRLIDAGRPAPQIGVGAPPPTTSVQHGLPPADVILVELKGDDPDPAATLTRAAAAGLPLDIRLVVDAPARVAELVALAAPLLPLRLAVFSSETHVTEPELWEALVGAVGDLGFETELVGGARSHFTELNRTHARLPAFPSWAISLTPQMHARDTFQLEECIGMQRRVAADATKIIGGAPLHVGPVTLRPRFNAVLTTPRPGHSHGQSLDPDTVDARQSEPQLAAWVIASAAALAEGGVASVTWFEERGPRGLVADDGTPYPVRDAVAAVHAMGGAPLLVPAETSPDDAHTWVLGVRTTGGARLLIARLGDTADHVLIDVDGHEILLPLEPGTWRAIDLEIAPHPQH
ncbi:hypothetical protein [Arthrobacter burdickii]|uniref:Uncharacterized protein n=1 Tax=Arthrobacter burdickii TaxID=3035920 RepID=A0ABT8JXI7_9MICC|nr:hypothetical protein [Arthrobacter burdickii]MDN4609885.1 hypothetical protein [Arthrobacter burdickii]